MHFSAAARVPPPRLTEEPCSVRTLLEADALDKEGFIQATLTAAALIRAGAGAAGLSSSGSGSAEASRLTYVCAWKPRSSWGSVPAVVSIGALEAEESVLISTALGRAGTQTSGNKTHRASDHGGVFSSVALQTRHGHKRGFLSLNNLPRPTDPPARRLPTHIDAVHSRHAGCSWRPWGAPGTRRAPLEHKHRNWLWQKSI